MSKLINTHTNRSNLRFQLLASVSAIVLIGFVGKADIAKAADGDSERPSVWIELGGQLSRLDDSEEAFSPPLMADRPSVLMPSQQFERLPLYSVDETGKVSFQPDGSDWVFSASVLYGRSGSDKHVRQQPIQKNFTKYYGSSGKSVRDIASGGKFADTLVRNNEQHVVLDFQAGRDVGLGMFGKDGSSVFSLGVRFAQFSSKSNIALQSDPDWRFDYKYFGTVKAVPLINGGIFHSNAAVLKATRSFHGIGPSLSWNASAPVAGALDHGEIALDWGLDAAVLFGRQKASVHHQATAYYHHRTNPGPEGARYLISHYSATPPARSRTITVPNVGGFAGLSFQIQNFKISAGYRADLFFGAMDGGIDTARKENVGFYGPFASVSVGLGG